MWLLLLLLVLHCHPALYACPFHSCDPFLHIFLPVTFAPISSAQTPLPIRHSFMLVFVFEFAFVFVSLFVAMLPCLPIRPPLTCTNAMRFADKPNPTLPIADLGLLKLTYSWYDSGQVQTDTLNCSSNYHSNEIDGQVQLGDLQANQLWDSWLSFQAR